MKIVCLVLSDHQFNNYYSKNTDVCFINVITDTFQQKNYLFIGDKNNDIVMALKYVHDNISYDYILVMQPGCDSIDLKKFDNEDQFIRLEGTSKIRGKYIDQDYFLVSKLDLRIKFHRKYVAKHGLSLDRILEDVILPF